MVCRGAVWERLSVLERFLLCCGTVGGIPMSRVMHANRSFRLVFGRALGKGSFTRDTSAHSNKLSFCPPANLLLPQYPLWVLRVPSSYRHIKIDRASL